MLLQINNFKSLSIFVMCLSSFNLLGQAIVNIEDLRREGEIGFFTNISANLNASRGNRDRDFYSAQLRFDNNSEEAEFFMILQQSERKSNDKLMDESTFMHGRYILVGEEAVNWELFIQFSRHQVHVFGLLDVVAQRYSKFAKRCEVARCGFAQG